MRLIRYTSIQPFFSTSLINRSLLMRYLTSTIGLFLSWHRSYNTREIDTLKNNQESVATFERVHKVNHQNGCFTLTLNSANECDNKIQFRFDPFSDTVASVKSALQNELPEIKKFHISMNENIQISGSTKLYHLYNGQCHHSVIDGIIAHSFTLFPVQLESAMLELENHPSKFLMFDEGSNEAHKKAVRKAGRIKWYTLSMMAFQFGFLGHLTFSAYSWDIMEPVTYFVTYATAVVTVMYYIVTRHEYSNKSFQNYKYTVEFLRHMESQKNNILKKQEKEPLKEDQANDK